jgi:hypothetical protein
MNFMKTVPPVQKQFWREADMPSYITPKGTWSLKPAYLSQTPGSLCWGGAGCVSLTDATQHRTWTGLLCSWGTVANGRVCRVIATVHICWTWTSSCRLLLLGTSKRTVDTLLRGTTFTYIVVLLYTQGKINSFLSPVLSFLLVYIHISHKDKKQQTNKRKILCSVNKMLNFCT